MESPFSLIGKRVLVTGASGEIGRETAILLARLGARLILNGRDEGRLEETARFAEGEPVVLSPFDLGDVDGIPAWLKSLGDAHGPIDGIVHCAGVSVTLPIRLMKWDKAEEVMRVNWGTSWALAKGLRQKGVRPPEGSRLVFISSSAGLVGETAMSAYCSSKGAVIALTRSLASELAAEKINVNSIAPGFIRTKMNARFLESASEDQVRDLEKRHPLGFGTTQDVAAAAAYLLSEAGRWVTGTTIAVDGGLTAV